MTTIVKTVLSGSTNGRGVKVVATASAGTTIHTAHSTSEDEIWLYAQNTDSTDRKLTIQWGGVTSPDDEIEFTVKAEDGLYLVVPGLILTGGLVVRAFCASANVVIIQGFVSRITP